MDPQVVHIDLEPSLGDHVSKDMIHERLKSWRGIAEAKEQDSGFKEAKRSDECHLPLVFLLNVNVVIAPSNIKLGEQCGVLHIIHQLRDEGERIPIANGVGIEISIILAWPQGSVFFGHKEKWRSLWGFQGYNSSCFQVFIDEGLADLFLSRVERVYFSNLGNEGVFEFNGMVERAMWRKDVVGLFREYIGKG